MLSLLQLFAVWLCCLNSRMRMMSKLDPNKAIHVEHMFRMSRKMAWRRHQEITERRHQENEELHNARLLQYKIHQRSKLLKLIHDLKFAIKTDVAEDPIGTLWPQGMTPTQIPKPNF